MFPVFFSQSKNAVYQMFQNYRNIPVHSPSCFTGYLQQGAEALPSLNSPRVQKGEEKGDQSLEGLLLFRKEALDLALKRYWYGCLERNGHICLLMLSKRLPKAPQGLSDQKKINKIPSRPHCRCWTGSGLRVIFLRTIKPASALPLYAGRGCSSPFHSNSYRRVCALTTASMA